MILAPIPLQEAVDVTSLIENLQRQGFVRLRVNDDLYELDEAASAWPQKLKNVEVVVDRLVIRKRG